MSFEKMALRGLSLDILVAPIGAPPVVTSTKAACPSDTLGLPPSSTLSIPGVPRGATNKSPEIGEMVDTCGLFRVLAIDGVMLGCNRNIVVCLSGEMTRVEPVCGEPHVYKCYVPISFDLPFVEMNYGPSLLADRGGCDAEGDGRFSGSYDSASNVVTLKAEVRGKVKCPIVGTVFDASASITVKKDLGEMTPCADFSAKAGEFILEGKACIRGNSVCFEDMELKAKGYKLASLGSFCVAIRSFQELGKCGCES